MALILIDRCLHDIVTVMNPIERCLSSLNGASRDADTKHRIQKFKSVDACQVQDIMKFLEA